MAKRKGRSKRNARRTKRTPIREQRCHPRLSICMIVRDEEKALPGCLESVRGLADELVIVDTGSRDGTMAIAHTYGARVFHFQWCDDFSAARNESLRHATGDWVLWIDADDRIDRRYHSSIRKLLKQPRDRAFAFVLENRGGDHATCTQIRLFPNLPGVKFSMPVHEQVTPSLAQLGITRVIPAPVVVTHTGYTDPETVRRKKQRYLEIMERWLEDHPDDYVTRAHVAMTYHTWEQPEKAIREYRRVVYASRCQEENPYLYRYALLFLGRSYMQQEAYDEAFAAFKEAEHVGAEPTLVHLSLGECYHRLQQPERAVEHLRYVRDHPMQRTFFPMDLRTLHYAAHHFLGINLARLGKFQEAIEAFRTAIEEIPDKLDARLELVKVYQAAGDWTNAHRQLIEMLERKLEHADVHHLLGVGALQAGHLSEALGHFERALEIDPRHGSAGTNRGVVLRALGKVEDARHAYLQVLEHHPQRVDTLANLAHLYLAERAFDDARRTFLHVLDLSPGDLDVHLGLAWASAELGDETQFRSAWEGVLGRLPQDLREPLTDGTIPPVERCAHLAEILRSNGNLPLAEYALRTALALDPRSEEWEHLGDLSWERGRFREAVDQYEQALLMAPERKRLFQKLGDCYAMLGVPEAERLCRERARG